MKKWIWLPVLLAVALLLLPGLLGQRLEPQLRAQLQTLTGPLGLFTSTVSSIDRGWFSTRVALDLAPAGPVGTLELVGTVRHGPVGWLNGPFVGSFRARIEAGPTNPRLQEFVQLAGLGQLFQLHLTGQFDGRGTAQLVVPPIAADGAALGDGIAAGAIQFSGMELAGQWQPDQGLVLAGDFESLLIKGEAAEFRVAGATLEADVRPLADQFWLGPMRLAFDVIDLRATGAPPSLALGALVLALQSTAQPGARATDVSITIRANSLDAPGVAVTDANVTAVAEALPVQVLADFSATGDGGRFLQALGTGGAQVSFAPIAFTADGQSLAGKLQLRMDVARLPQTEPVNWSDPALWVGLLTAEGAVQVAQPLAQRMVGAVLRTQMVTELAAAEDIGPVQIDTMAALQAPLRLAGFVERGYLRESGDGYAVALRYAAGELQLNQQTLPLVPLVPLLQ